MLQLDGRRNAFECASGSIRMLCYGVRGTTVSSSYLRRLTMKLSSVAHE